MSPLKAIGFPPEWALRETWNTEPWIDWIHIASNLVIFLTYVAVPFVVHHFIRQRRDIRFAPSLTFLFAVVLFACGFTHLVDCFLYWFPIYEFSGIAKLIAAIISVIGAMFVTRFLPQALELTQGADYETAVKERKEAEKELRLTSNRLLLATKAGGVGVWDYDIATGKLVWDDEMFRLYGITSEEFTGTYETWEKLVHPDDLDAAVQKLQLAQHGDAVFDTEFRIIWPKDNSVHFMRAHATVLRDSGGNPSRMIGVNWDNTELREREAELEVAKEKAESAARAKSDFLAKMSHEIRTPMNGIMGLTDILLSSELKAEQREYLKLIDDSSQSLLSVVNDILDFSKIEAGKLRLDIAAFTLRESLYYIMASLETIAQKKGLELKCEVDEEVPDFLRGDLGRIRQILINLTGNALKFTSEGEIVVRVTQERQENGISTVHFTVHDTGRGIAKNKQDRIFGAFNQEEKFTARNHGGTGLGLTICKSLVDLMNGKIWLESTLGKGSSFHFSLPLAIAEEAEISNSQDQEPTAPVSLDRHIEAMHLLLVEDGRINRIVASKMLRDRGHTVATADDGEEALEAFKNESFDAIIMDVQMPNMDGYAATEAIREYETKEGGHVPIIAMTANALKGDREKCLAAGMDDYVAKPIRARELCAALEKFGTATDFSDSNSPAPSTRTDNLDVFDSESFRSFLGDESLMKELTEVFPKEAEKFLDEAEKAIREQDAEALHLASHTLKGTLGNYSSKRSLEAAKSLEQAAKENDLSASPALLEVCRNEIQRLQNELNSFSATLDR